MKTITKVALLAIIILLISAVIIAANLEEKKAIPIQVSELEDTTEFFEGAYITTSTNQTNYTIGQNIHIHTTITNKNNTPVQLQAGGLLNKSTDEFYPHYKISIYDAAYQLIFFEDFYANNPYSPPYPIHISTSKNITLQPQESLHSTYIWNQTRGAYAPPELYGTQVPPGEYHMVTELIIDWNYYYGLQFPLRFYGAITTIGIEE